MTPDKPLSMPALIRLVLANADRPLTLRDIDGAICAARDVEASPETRKATSVRLTQMKQRGEIRSVSPGRANYGAYVLAEPVRQTAAVQPRPWRPLKVEQPYRREPRVAPGIRVTPPATTIVTVGPGTRTAGASE